MLRLLVIIGFFLISGGWFHHGVVSSLPNVPGYDVFPIMYQSNNFSGIDYDYVWSTYDQSGTPGVYTAGIDSNWGTKLFQYGWIQTPAQITTCTASPCQGDFAGLSNANPSVGYFITMMRDNYIPNKLQSNRTGVLVVPCAEGGAGYHLATNYTYNTNAGASAGTSTITMAHNWGVINGATVADLSNPAAIPSGTTILSFTSTSIVLSANISSPGVSSGDYIQFNNGIGDWQAGGQLYEGCLARTNEAIANNPGSRLVAVLGNGGEADSGYAVSQAQYTTYTQTMTADFRSRATGGANTPFLFGGMVPGWVASIGAPAIAVEAAISNMPSNVTRSAFVDPIGLAAPVQYTAHYTVGSITVPSNPCALTVLSANPYSLVNGATARFTNFTGTTELNGSWPVTVVSETAGVSADITVPVNCTNAWTGGSGQAYLVSNITGTSISFIHFSSESQRELGNRYYTALVPFL